MKRNHQLFNQLLKKVEQNLLSSYQLLKKVEQNLLSSYQLFLNPKS